MPLALLILALAPPAERFALDADRLAFRGVEDDAPIRDEAVNPLEFEAYNAALLHARQFPSAELAAAAERDVTFRDLVLPVRQAFRFKLVSVDGRLKGVRRYEATKPLVAAGVPVLYECWLFPDAGDAPLCFLATDLPDGLDPRQNYTPAVPVTAAGYSFKLLRYESAEPHPKDPARRKLNRAPLLMGRSLILRPTPPTVTADRWLNGFLPGLATLGGGLAAAALGLTLWYRRGDRAARAVLAARHSHNPFADPDPAGR